MRSVELVLEVPAVLVAKRVSLIAGLVVASLVLTSMGVVAQESEEFLGPDAQSPLAGYTRGDGTVVLTDESFCRYVLGFAVGYEPLTYVQLLDKTKKQKKARKAAFRAVDDDAVARCVEILTASRTEAPDADTLAAWARTSAVVPESMAGLLPEDFTAQPLAQPDEIGAAARTSGFGDLVSAPFSVTPGPWLAELDAAACASWDGTLRDARDPDDAYPLEDSREYLYDLDGGHYYWDVTASDCDWSVDLVPVVLGPEPTATPAPDLRVPAPALHGTNWDRRSGQFLLAAEARQTLLDAGLTVGECVEEEQWFEGAKDPVSADRVWYQEPVPGTLVQPGSAIDVWMTSGCDIVRGDRIVAE